MTLNPLTVLSLIVSALPTIEAFAAHIKDAASKFNPQHPLNEKVDGVMLALKDLAELFKSIGPSIA